ncbi:MAG: hypothetical protein IKU01_01115 [Bacteroidales bacterium]|nr:hypothetical protein [Bacteroidales bacterium]
MKKYVLLIIAISVMAFQACKKDELTNPDRTSRTPQTQKTEASAFNPRNIGDMDSYLTNFLKEIKSPTRDAQPMTVEDAQWHISACLNFLFSNANVNKTQIVYDTIVTTINVNDGYISLNEINESLQDISTKVLGIYNSNDLENKNILFIAPMIQDESLRGTTTVRTVVAISNYDTEYHYLNESDINMLDSIIPYNSSYLWCTEAIEVLKCFINHFKPTLNTDPSQRIYYIVTHTKHLNYSIDYLGNKIFWTDYGFYKRLGKEEIIYYLDSYLDLIDRYNPSNPEFHNGVATTTYSYISISIIPNTQDRECMMYYHNLYINYGEAYVTQTPQIPFH